MPQSLGDSEQIRAIVEQVAEISADRAIAKHNEDHVKVEIPAPLKWASAIIAALFTAGVAGFCFWLVTTLNDMQIAVSTITTQLGQSGAVEARFQSMDRRVERLEQIHADEMRDMGKK